jgi:hypothetical protein
MGFAKCRDCQEWIIWARDGEKQKPFNANPRAWIVMEDGEDDQGREQHVAVRVTDCHWDTCPKKKKPQGGQDGGSQEG